MSRPRSEVGGCWLEVVLIATAVVGLVVLTAYGAAWVTTTILGLLLKIWLGA